MLAEPNGEGVSQNLASPAREKIPHVSLPYSLGLQPADQLGNHRLDPPTQLDQPPGLGFLVPLGRNPPRGQFFPLGGVPVVPVTDHPSLDPCRQIAQHLQLVDVGRGQFQADNDPRPGDAEVSPKAIEGLLRHLLIAIGGLTGKAPAPVGAGETADRDRKAVHERNQRIVTNESQQVLPDFHLHPGQVRRLADEGGAVDAPQVGEPVSPVTTEVLEDRFVRIQPQELTHDFDGHHLAITQKRLRSSLAQPFVFQPVIHEAEHSNEKCGKIFHRSPPFCLRLCFCLTERYRGLHSFFRVKTCTWVSK